MEYIKMEYIKMEYIKMEYINKEYINKDYIKMEYIKMEYIKMEYIKMEYINKDYIKMEYINMGSFATFGKLIHAQQMLTRGYLWIKSPPPPLPRTSIYCMYMWIHRFNLLALSWECPFYNTKSNPHPHPKVCNYVDKYVRWSTIFKTAYHV